MGARCVAQHSAPPLGIRISPPHIVFISEDRLLAEGLAVGVRAGCRRWFAAASACSMMNFSHHYWFGKETNDAYG